MKKLTNLLAVAALLLTSCGPATYDIDDPEGSSAEMLEPLSQEERSRFEKSLQRITLKRIQEENMTLMDLVKICKDAEKMKQLLQCLDGKTVDEIIEMAQ